MLKNLKVTSKIGQQWSKNEKEKTDDVFRD